MSTGRAVVLGWLLLLPFGLVALVLLVLDVFTELHTTSEAAIYAAAFIPFAWVAVVLAGLGLILAAHRWWRLTGVAVLAAAAVAWGVPLAGPMMAAAQSQTAPEPQLVVFSLNTAYGRADARQIRLLLDESVDVLVFQEYTPEFEDDLRRQGLLDRFPHRIGTARADAGGTMLLSRLPLTEVSRLDTAFDNILVSLEADGARWLVGAVHTSPPQMGAPQWARSAAKVTGLALEHADERLVLVGDFNAIDRHHTMRVLTKGPLRDLMEGSPGLDAWRPTWPAHPWLPTFARIDHAVVSEVVGGPAPDVVRIEGTDHLGLLVSVHALA